MAADLPTPDLPDLGPDGPPGPPEEPGLPSWLAEGPPDLPPPLPPACGDPPEAEPLPAEPVPAIKVEKGAIRPRPRTLAYGIVAQNNTRATIYQVRVEHQLPEGVRHVASDPPARRQGDTLVWDLGDLAPGARRNLRVHVTCLPGAGLPAVGQASFALYQCLRTQTPLTRPRLAVALAGPECLEAGQPAILRVRVGNQGTAPAANVVVRTVLPDGLHHPDGPRLELPLGTLEPGQSAEVTLPLTGKCGGVFHQEVTASADGAAQASARQEVEVLQAALELRLSGPARCALDRPFEYAIEVGNAGTAGASGVAVTLTLPAEFDFLVAAAGGRYDPATRQLTWAVGPLAPRATRALAVQVAAREPGAVAWQVLASAAHTPTARAEASVLASPPVDLQEGEDDRLLGRLVAGLDADARAAGSHSLTPMPAGTLGGRPEPAERHVLFSLGGTDYAVGLTGVVETGRPPVATPVPAVPDWVVGVANVRGDIVSLVDLGAFLGLKGVRITRPGGGRLLVVRSASADEVQVGLLVEQVKGICVLPTGRLRPLPGRCEGRVASYLAGVAEFDGRLLAVLDLERLLQSPELRQFELV